MKKFLSVWIFACFTLNVSAETISIRADDWFPMNGNPNDLKPGYMIELAKAIFTPLSVTVDYKMMPWERALHEARAGNIDCVVGAYKDDAPDFVFPNEHWGLDETSFFVQKSDQWKFDGNLENLSKRKVGVITGYAYDDEFDAMAEKLKGVAFQFMTGDGALDKNIKKLLAGRLDTLVESTAVFNSKTQEMGVQKQVKSAGSLTEAVPMYIACTPNSEKSKRLMKMVDDAMPKLRGDGTLTKIMSNYGLDAW